MLHISQHDQRSKHSSTVGALFMQNEMEAVPGGQVWSPAEAGLPAQQGSGALSLFQSKSECLPAWKFQSLSGWPVSELTQACWETFCCVTNETLPCCMPWVLVLRTARLLGTLQIYSSSFLPGETLSLLGFTHHSHLPVTFKGFILICANQL